VLIVARQPRSSNTVGREWCLTMNASHYIDVKIAKIRDSAIDIHTKRKRYRTLSCIGCKNIINSGDYLTVAGPLISIKAKWCLVLEQLRQCKCEALQRDLVCYSNSST
jgi:hypothetical protein